MGKGSFYVFSKCTFADSSVATISVLPIHIFLYIISRVYCDLNGYYSMVRI